MGVVRKAALKGNAVSRNIACGKQQLRLSDAGGVDVCMRRDAHDLSKDTDEVVFAEMERGG